MKTTEIPASQGLAGEINGRPVAVYNNGDSLIVLENICTHLGCECDWNADDQTWDCPCHGSRYDAEGQVVRGPAQNPLQRLAYAVQDGEIKIEGI